MAVYGGLPPVACVTLTLPVLNRAQRIILLVSGLEKAETVRAVLAGSDATLPEGMVRPVNGTLEWLLEQEVARLLKGWKDRVP